MSSRLPGLLCLLLLSPLAGARQTVTLAVTEGTAPGQMGKEMAAVVSHLNTSPHISVVLKVYPNHDALSAALAKNEVDLAFLGAVKYVQAHFEFGAEPLVSEGGGARSSIVVAPGSAARSLKDLRGKRIAFGYQDSTTTHLIPLLLFSKSGVRAIDLKESFLGHQPQKLIDAMLRGEYDACAVSDYVLAQNKARVRVLETSDWFPGPPIVARKNLGNALKVEVRRMFLSYRAPATASAQHFGTGAKAATDTDYNRIRFLCKVVFGKTYQ